MQLDAKTIADLTLPIGKTEQFYWDEILRGFGVRLRLRGNRLHRTWVAQYRSDGRTRRPTLGPVETVLPTEARAAARKVLAKAALGGDPQGEKEAKRQAATKTFRSVVASYLEAKARMLRASSLRVTKLYLEGPYFKPLHITAVTSVTHADVAACIRSIERDHSTATAAAARRALSAFFAWAIAEGMMGCCGSSSVEFQIATNSSGSNTRSRGAGATGPQGIRGPKGEPGPRGLTGEAGPKGASGAVIIGWTPDYAAFRATPVMSDGSEGPALDLRPFFQEFLDQTQRQ
jgi:hypothetical protein